MRRLRACAVALLLSFGASLSGFAEQLSNERAHTSSDTGWIRLFDGKSLDGWYTCLEGQKKNEDPAKVFQVNDGVIHVYKDQTGGGDVPKGYFATESEYAYYRLRFEYKWGNKRFRPRVTQRRDAGVLYHLIAPDKVWPRCIECQIQENDTGDCYTVRGTQVVTSVEAGSRRNRIFHYKPEADGGVPQTVGDAYNARISKSSTPERDGWNTVELIVRGSEETMHIVNGHTVFQAKDLRKLGPDNKNWEPLTHGRIAFQAEYAEILYRNIVVRAIADGPLYPAADSTLHVADGFEVVQVAGPPLVDFPTLACFDDKGRLYVSEGANNNDPFDVLVKTLPRSIRRLEDSDGDGIFDRSAIFADKMTFPYGGAWHDGALYVASDPTLWRLEDTDDDGVADRREEVITGFRSGGLASAMKGGFFGPDGWLYFNGGNEKGYDLRGRDGTRLVDNLARPCVFRMRPDGTKLEVVSNGAAGVYELCFEPAGDLFGIVTILKYPRGDGLMHWLDGGAYQSSHSTSPYVARTGRLLPPLVEWGQTSPSGMQRYEGAAFGDEYAGNFFTAHFNTHEVTRNVIQRRGATWQSFREDILLKSDRLNFRPTDVLEDADGSLLVINTGGWFRIGCPTARVDASDLKGAIYRIRRTGMKQVDDPRGLKIRWSDESPERLVARLDDERFAVRERAIEQLARRGVTSLPALHSGLRNPSAQVRRNVVWALTRIDCEAARSAVGEALGDTETTVVLAALHSAGLWQYARARDHMIELLKSNEPSIRREAACSLGRLKDASAVPVLVDALRNAYDRFEEHALIYALIEINSAKSTSAGLESDDPRICRGSLIALDRMRDGQLTEQMIAPLLKTGDLELQRAVLDVFARHPQWTNGVLDLLRRWLAQSKPSIEQRELLSTALWQFRKESAVQELVAESLMADNISTAMQALLLDVIGSGKVKARPAVWHRPIVRALGAREESVAQRAVEAAASVARHVFLQDLKNVALDSTRPLSLRLSAAAAVAEDKTPLDEQVFDLLVNHCVAPETDPLTRLSLVRSLGNAHLNTQQLDRLINVAAAAGPLELPSLFRAFEEAAALPDGKKLFKSISASPGIENLAERRIETLLKRYPKSVQEQVRRTLLPLKRDSQVSVARLQELKSALQGGDPTRGRELFFTKATCHACHRVGGKGNTIGPDLTNIGKIRSRQDLLESVVFPSASFARGYEPIIVITRAGLTFSGYCGRETFDAILLVTADRSEVSIARDDIEEIVPSQVSNMPQGLDQNLTEYELRDVLAFLESNR